MRKIKVAFLWHMHQPYYKDDVECKIVMPWVFLHAIKDYYELLWHIKKFPKIRATFNLVPSLLKQLKEYERESVDDLFLNLWRSEPKSLSQKQKFYLVNALFHAKFETMIRPLERFLELYLEKERVGIDNFCENISSNELIDLEILYLLSWCGEYLRESSEIVKSLLLKKRGFSAIDKETLFSELIKFNQRIIKEYENLQNIHKIEISTTPFYHPITPLLIDMQNAKRSNPNLLAPSFEREFYSDAKEHIKDAIEYYKNMFKTFPRGFWPSEGSVSNEVLELFSDEGILWSASDEDVLFKSIKSNNRDNIYKKYRLKSYGREINIFFRDKILSDKIGFNYSNGDIKECVDDFLDSIYAIRDLGGDFVPIILDGENAWEYYENNGRDFFEKLYERIEQDECIECVTFEELSNDSSIETIFLDSIEPGSWIYGDFGIWVGESEENRAWELLKKSREYLFSKRDSIPEELFLKAYEEIKIAQGSDWFWWYGSDHFTPIKNEYDELFRKHLQNIYTIIGEEIPNELYQTIIVSETKIEQIVTPLCDLDIDSILQESSYFNWSSSGRLPPPKKFSTMSSSDLFFEEIRYGKDGDSVILGIRGKMKLDHTLEIDIECDDFKERFRFLLDSEFLKAHIRGDYLVIVLEHLLKKSSAKIDLKLTYKDKIVQSGLQSFVELDFDYKKNWYI